MIRAVLLVLALALVTPAWGQDDRGEQGAEQDALALGPDVARAVGPPAGPPLTGTALDLRTNALAEVVRCPVCQGLSLNDSPSESARNMLRQVRAMIAAGYDDDQVLLYFETAYGEFIRMVPRARGFNLLVWIIPVVGLLAGLWLVRRAVLRREDVVAEQALPPIARQKARESDEALDPFLAQVRAELAEPAPDAVESTDG